MSDLTFATPSQTNPSPINFQQKSNKLTRALIVVIVIALLAQLGYFFYSRYISNSSNLPFKNLSNNETMNYEGDGANSPVADEPINNPSQMSQVGPAYLDKGISILEAIEQYPEEFLIKSELKWSVQGKVVRVDIKPFDDGVQDFGAQIILINTKGDVMGLRMTPTELSKLKVVHVHQGVLQKELALEDLKPGNMLDITTTLDMFDMRTSADNVLIEVRTY